MTTIMKKYIPIFIGSVLMLSSCAGKLDLLPQQNTTSEIALSSDANVKRVLRGAYDEMSDAYVLGGDMMLFSELLAADGEITWEGTYPQPREVYTKQILVTNSYVTEGWLRSFEAINVANNILSAIDIVAEDDQDRVKGEALLLRAVVYFQLVQLYAQPYSAGNAATAAGIPIVLTPTTVISDANKLPRNTLEATYAQILKDAIEAETLLPETNDVFFNKVAAWGYLSRIYLQMGNYQKALEASNQAISLAKENGFALTPTYAAAFNNAANSTEDLFAIQVSDQDGANDMQLFFSIPDYGGRDGDVSIQDKHLNLYETGDARKALFYEGNGGIRSGKWKLQYKNLSLMRLAEMYLTRAESNFRLSTTTGATPAEDLNLVRKRAGLAAIAKPTLANILKERKLELAHEGQAIQDVKRLKGKTDGLDYNAPKLVLPIPKREIDASGGNLKQNDGY